MSKLYRNRYLIAVYDGSDEHLLGVFDRPDDMKSLMGVNGVGVRVIVSRAMQYVDKPRIAKNYKYSLHFIDIYEKHDDCFAEEDAIFLKELGLSPDLQNENERT